MKFTDDDLTELKDKLEKCEPLWISSAAKAFKLKALLARLEAAESFINVSMLKNLSYKEVKKWVAWRKAKGEVGNRQ